MTLLTLTQILPGLLEGEEYRDTANDLIIFMEGGAEGRIAYKMEHVISSFSEGAGSRTVERTHEYRVCRSDFTTAKFTKVKQT